MLHVALYQPQIPGNTGSIGRTCLALEARLHLIGKLGFSIDEGAVRRAGLDYWKHVDVARHNTIDELLAELPNSRIWAFSTKAEKNFREVEYQDGDCLLFGPEDAGFSAALRERLADNLVNIPIVSPHVRSLNLSNAAAIALYEAWMQIQERRDATR